MKHLVSACLLSTLILGVSCSKKKDSDDDKASSTTIEAMPNVMTSTLALMPEIKGSYGLTSAAFEAADKMTYRNDIPFQVYMRFASTTDDVLQLGNENMRNNLENLKPLADMSATKAGSTTIETDSGSVEVTIEEKAATEKTVSPFDFGTTLYSSFDNVRTVTVAGETMGVYMASKLEGVNGHFLLTNQGSASSSEGSGTGNSTTYGDYKDTTKGMQVYYASNTAYDSGAHFIIRMDFDGNVESNDFSMKMTLRSVSKPNASSGAGGFAMVAKGNSKIPEAGGEPNFVVTKVRNCLDSDAANQAAGYDSANCLSEASAKWVCFDTSATMADWAAFVKATDTTSRNTAKIMLFDDKASFTDKCLELANAVDAITFIAGNESDMPKAKTTYHSTLGY